MAEVAYLLGAGASANCVPVIEKMAEDIGKTIEEYNNLEKFIKDFDTSFRGGKIDYLSIYETLKGDLISLQEECYNHFSIDTYAKKLFLTRSKEYNKLKATLSFYLTFKQVSTKADVRYDNFWASVLTNSTKLPNKIKIISWNYDFQLEKSYLNMTNMGSLNRVDMVFNTIHPRAENWNDAKNGFEYLKMNGSARIYSSIEREAFYLCDYEDNQEFKDLFQSLLFRYYLLTKYSSEYSTHLFFAWESVDRIKMESQISPFLNTIKVLAIIGYSFPFFNRDIDTRLFKMLNGLEVIYIQDLAPEIIAERLREIILPNINIKLINDVRQFVFPKELEVI